MGNEAQTYALQQHLTRVYSRVTVEMTITTSTARQLKLCVKRLQLSLRAASSTPNIKC